MDARDYHLWKQMQQELRLNPQLAVNVPTIAPEEELEDDVFEAVSKRAWTDILLQILKVHINSQLPKYLLHKTYIDV